MNRAPAEELVCFCVCQQRIEKDPGVCVSLQQQTKAEVCRDKADRFPHFLCKTYVITAAPRQGDDVGLVLGTVPSAISRTSVHVQHLIISQMAILLLLLSRLVTQDKKVLDRALALAPAAQTSCVVDFPDPCLSDCFHAIAVTAATCRNDYHQIVMRLFCLRRQLLCSRLRQALYHRLQRRRRRFSQGLHRIFCCLRCRRWRGSWICGAFHEVFPELH
mmetsp:Transcript_27217/g.63893  ORF Transcript_27217/g.63893 Transcript_27217/m.63893 type:complete len:218 (-) Transcript_27217:262-915(-)